DRDAAGRALRRDGAAGTVHRRRAELLPNRPLRPKAEVHHMRAAIFVEPKSDLSLEDVPALPPGPRDVVVRLLASGVCQSDQAVIDRMPGGNPMILGHEACGVVDWVGAEVS